MRLAAIDVGSNSLHMVVADVGREGQLEVVDRVKEMVRLGRRSFITGRLTDSAMALAVRTLKNFRRLAELHKVVRIRAVATSAVREASNRAAFLARIRRESGLKVEVVSGAEEARLIFVAARYAMGLDGGPHLLLDVGGGSVELVLVRDGIALWTRSMPLGVARLTERFIHHDPPSKSDVAALRHHLARALGHLLDDARHSGAIRVVGTSGTVNTLVAMARAARGGELGRLHGASASALEIARLRRWMVEWDAAEREEMPGADAKRSDLTPAAAILADYVLVKSKAPELVACSWALREGLLLELAGLASGPHEHAGAIANGAGAASRNGRGSGAIDPSAIRRRSVEALATRFAGANEHGRQVARLSLQLFDAIADKLNLSPESRELVEYAALLHDIGRAIDHDRHNRHSYYLIRNADLLGFEPVEIDMIALVARSHRKQAAKLDSPELGALPQAERRMVRAMVSILRIADALDRSHLSVVKGIHVAWGPARVLITVDSSPGADDLELWTCERRTDLLAKLLNRPVTVRQESCRIGRATLHSAAATS